MFWEVAFFKVNNQVVGFMLGGSEGFFIQSSDPTDTAGKVTVLRNNEWMIILSLMKQDYNASSTKHIGKVLNINCILIIYNVRRT